MINRECGIYHTDYRSEMALYRVPLARWSVVGVLVVAYLVIPWIATDYWYSAILLPFLIFAIAAIGLNLLTGYCGQVSLGHAAFMAVGGYTAAVLVIQGVPFLASVIAAGLLTTLVGLAFGIPSARIKGLYLALATLGAQFMVPWALSRVVPLLVPAGLAVAGGDTIYPPQASLFGWVIDSYRERYLFTLAVLTLLTVAALNLVRSRVGRAWIAIRDHDVAARILGINLTRYKLLAFGVSTFYAGVAGALSVFFYYGVAHAGEFGLDLSIRLLAVVLIGGMGSIIGNFFGSALLFIVPIFLNRALTALGNMAGFYVGSEVVTGAEFILFGLIVVVLLIWEPQGLAKLWQNVKDYFRLWPFSY